ncbi:MAG TPA: glycosyltransferase family 2 protein [Puia sp.]|nr:glycosyltransferase family 2 protein [Puia sp.]
MADICCSIVLFHNDPEELRLAVNSFMRSALDIKLYLVDNSEDDTLRYEFDSPRIEYIFSGKNIGYGAGHNLAIDKSRRESKYHLVLNPDIEFDPEVLDSLIKFMDHNADVGLVMPKVLYRSGDIQYLCKRLPAPTDLFLRRFIPGRIKFLFKEILETYELKFKDYDSVMEVPNLSGCFMFIRTDVFEQVGAFDEQYFLYLEDTDLCRRINESYRTVYYPKVSIVHGYKKGSYKSLKLMGYHLRSSIRYFNKWGWFDDKSRMHINRSLVEKTQPRQGLSHFIIPA